MHDPQRVDWFRILVQLQRLGHPLQRVADETGINRWTLRSYMAGGIEPSHWRGQVLIAYWSRVTGKPQDIAPLSRRPSPLL